MIAWPKAKRVLVVGQCKASELNGEGEILYKINRSFSSWLLPL